MAGKINLSVLLSVFMLLLVMRSVWATTPCANNWAGGVCIGAITYTANTVLTKTINVSGAVIINSGVSLTTNGFSILTSGNFVNNGIITTGNVIGHQALGGTGVGPNGFTETNSLPGSGAGGGGASTSGIGGTGYAGGRGGNTLVGGGAGGAVGSAGGNGNPPGSPPLVTNANIVSWNATGFSTIFAGAGGGAGGAHGANNGGNGGNGAYGLYIQAGNIIAGTIHANGGAGSSSGTRTGGGGGGAGGFVLLAYGGTLTAGAYTFTGGAAGAAGGSGGHAGGTGGAGNVVSYAYTTPPLNVIALLSVPAPTPSTQNVDQGQIATITDSGAIGGIKPYTYQWIATSVGSSTYNAAQANTLCGSSANTLSCSFTTVLSTTSGTYMFEFNAIDSGSSSNTVTSSSVNVVVKTAPTATSLMPSNVQLDSGQSLVYNVLISNGAGPFTVNLVASNSVVLNTITGASAGTVKMGAIIPPAGTDAYHIVAYDTGTAATFTFNSISNTVIVSSALSAPSAPTISDSKLDVDQAETVTGTIPSTGTSPYTYNWLVSDNGGGYAATTQCATNSGTNQIAGNTVTCSIPGATLSAGHNYAFELKVTDGASTPETATSASSTVTTNSQLTRSTKPLVSASQLDVLQAETVNSIIPSTGTSPYSYTWHVSINGGSYQGATQCTVNTGSNQISGNTVTCTIPSNTLTGGNTYNFELEVTDSASAPEGAFSAASNTITVNPTSIPGFPSVSAVKLDVDQVETVTGVTPLAGTPPYTYNWLLSDNGGSYAPTTQCATNSGTGQPDNSVVTCTISGNTLTLGHTYAFELRITDSDTIPDTTNSVPTNTVTVSSQLTGSTKPLISASQLDADQTETVNSVIPSTGTSPYFYTWHISVNGGSYQGATQCTVNTGSGQISGNTVTCNIPANTLGGGNTYNFELEVTDSASAPEGTFSTASNTVTVSSKLTAPSTPSISASKLDVNQPETVTDTMPLSGSSPYGYTWLVSDNGGSYAPTTQCTVNTGANQISGNTVTCTISANTLATSHTYNFELKATDNAMIPETANSIGSPTVTVYSMLSTPTPVVSEPKLDLDQAETVTGTIPSTGASPYSYSWSVSVNGGSYASATQCAVNSGSGQIAGNTVTCSISGNTLSVGSTYNFELQVTDSASTPATAASSSSPTMTVYSQLTGSSTPSISASAIDADQVVAISSTMPSTGTLPYSYAWQISTNGGAYMHSTQCTANIGSNQIAGNTVTCTIPANTLAAGSTYSLKLELVDSATVTEDVVSAGSNTVTVSSKLTAPSTPSISAQKVDIDQVETVTAIIPSTGTSQYSYTWLVSINNAAYAAATQCATNSGTNQDSGSVVCSISSGTLTAGQTYNFELQVADAASTPETTTSSPSSQIAASSQLTGSTKPLVSASQLDVLQAETVNSIIPSTGTSPYSYTWHVSINGGSYQGATQCTVNTGSNQISGNTVTCTIPSNTLGGGNTYNFELEVTDSASAPEGAFSAASNTVTVNPTSIPGFPSVSAVKLDIDQIETVTGVTPLAGTPPYTYNWLLSDNGGSYAPTTQCATNSGTGQPDNSVVTCTILGSTLTLGHTYAFKLQITDSDTIPDTTNSAPTNTVTVSSQLTGSTTPSLVSPVLDADQSETITSVIPSTGTSPYSYTWHISVNGGSYQGATQCTVNTGSGQISGNTVTCNIPANTLGGSNTYNFELEATDSASAPEGAFSSASNDLPVSSPLIVSQAPTVSAPALDADQAEAITGTIPSSGSSQYSYTWLISDNGNPYTTATQCSPSSGTNQNSGGTVTCNIAGSTLSAGHNYAFELQVTDSASTPETAASSASQTVNVLSQLTSAAAPSISGSVIDANQTETITGVIPATGTPPYAYHWHLSIDGGAYFHPTVCTANIGSNQIAGNTVTCTIVPNTLSGGNTYTFLLHVLDNATLSESTLSPSATTITVGVTPTASSLTPSASQLTEGQTVTYSVIVNDGIGPFTANIVASNGTVMNTMTGQIAGTITFGAFTPPAGADSYNAVVTDTGTTAPYVFSSGSSSIAVTGGLNQVLGIGTQSTTSTSTTTTVVSTTTVLIPQQNLNVSGNNVSTTISVPSNGTSTLDLNDGQAYLAIKSSSAGYFNITITNVTNNSTIPSADHAKLLALKVTVSGAVQPKPRITVLMKMSYNCGIPSGRIAPYLLSNGTWQPIIPFSVNASACTVSFSMNVDPVVALFESILPATTTVPATSVPSSTTIAQTPTPSPSSNTEYILVAIAVAVILIAIYLASRKKKKAAPTG